MKSKITGGPTEVAFSAKVLNKYDVTYFKCMETGFIQTEDPYWLDEAYSSAITKLDIGMLYRNEVLRNTTTKILSSFFDGDKRFLDYAGGYGIFTRMMRDKGYDFYHSDIYCQNIFAEYFDIADCPQKDDFELVTAFEVFEHLNNPLDEINAIVKLGKNLLFSTEIQPSSEKDISGWWYISAETGQHISFYTMNALEFIAKKLGMYFSSNGTNLHLFSKEKPQSDPFDMKDPFLVGTMRRKVSRFDAKKDSRETLLIPDFNYIKSQLKS